MESRSATRALHAELIDGAGSLPGLLPADPRVHTLAPDVLDAARSDPAALRETLRRQFPRPDDLGLLVIGCDESTPARCADVRDWTQRLHQPMARCFTLLTAAMPLVQRAPDGGHAVLVVACNALVPDPQRGPGSVLGRGLLGLFEGLAAELRRTATRVTIFLTHDSEPDETLRARFAAALHDRPLFTLPASMPPAAVRGYFRPIAAALHATPAGASLPAGPMGVIYRAAVEAIGPGVGVSDPPAC